MRNQSGSKTSGKSQYAVVAYHGTMEEIKPGELEADWGCRSEPSGVGLWLSEDKADAFDYARSKGQIHIIEVDVEVDRVLICDSWGALEREVKEQGGPVRAREAFLGGDIAAALIDRGPAAPREWVVFDTTILSPTQVLQVSPGKNSEGQPNTSVIWNSEDAVASPVSR